HIESNGDLATADLMSDPPTWSLFPTAGGKNSDPIVDSIRSDGTHIRVTGDRSFVEEQVQTFLSKSYQCFHTLQTDSNSAARPSDSTFSVMIQTQDIWFIPEIGTFGTLVISERDSSNNNRSGFTTTATLVE